MVWWRALMRTGSLDFGYRVLAIGIAAAFIACAGPSWDGQVYRDDSLAFRAGKLPPGWRKLDDDNSLLTFRDAQHDLLISVNGRCGKDGDDVPLEALTQHLFVYFTERQIGDQRRVSLDGREAMRTVLSARLDGVARRFVVYVLKKNGCVYDFILIAPPSLDAASIAQFDQFVAGFSTGKNGPGDPRKMQVQP